jgi:hypothetical protein
MTDENTERIRVLKQDVSTYADHAATDASPGGRFAHLSKPTIVKGGPDYPQQPAGSPWRRDPVPDEPPLNVDVNRME